MSAPSSSQDRTPVIIGVGEVVDRTLGEGAKEPKTLIAAAARAAEADAGAAVLGDVDDLAVINVASFSYADLPRLLATEFGASPSRAEETEIGGEKPILALAGAAGRLANGESELALICGGESLKTRMDAARAQRALEWGPADPGAKPVRAADLVSAVAARVRLVTPSEVYPLYENACRAAWGQSLTEAQAETARLWARAAEVAAGNPSAWMVRTPPDAQEIATPTERNRLIAFPYTKLMNALLAVNQAGAMIVTTRAEALRRGVAEDRMVPVGRAVFASEPSDFLLRDRYDRSAAQDAVLSATLRQNDVAVADVDLFELYSCFPCVPKMARRALGFGADVDTTFTGGLTFFGGPANNYMTHAIAAAVRELRKRRGAAALLYGQGEYVTKHAGLVLGAIGDAATGGVVDVESEAAGARGAAPVLDDNYEGPATLETYTVLYDRDGAPNWVPIIARTPGGARVAAAGDAGSPALLRLLTSGEREPIGSPGAVSRNGDGLQLWSL